MPGQREQSLAVDIQSPKVNERLKKILAAVLDPKSIIFGLALFNFIFIWIEARQLAVGGIACLVCPWYDPWSYDNEPTLILVASLFLRLNRVWSFIVAILISGYLIFHYVYLFMTLNVTLMDEWRYLRQFEPYFIGAWDSQYLFAFIVLCFTCFYLTRRCLLKMRPPLSSTGHGSDALKPSR